MSTGIESSPIPLTLLETPEGTEEDFEESGKMPEGVQVSFGERKTRLFRPLIKTPLPLGKLFAHSFPQKSAQVPLPPMMSSSVQKQMHRKYPSTPNKTSLPHSSKAVQIPHLPPQTSAQVKQLETARPQTKEAKNITRDGRKEVRSSLPNRAWTPQKSEQWWQTRYDQKEREGKRDQNQQQDGEQKQRQKRESNPAIENEKKKRDQRGEANLSISATTPGGSARPSPQFHPPSPEVTMSKPLLEKPRTGVFALYYILTKIGIISDGSASQAYKSELEAVNEETTAIHEKRLEALKKAVQKERSAGKWGIMYKVFSWMTSVQAVITGVAMCMTGVGAATGALLIAGGLIQITNQLLEITGGWKKVAESLPGDDPKQKRAVVAWMQIGISVLCLALCASGVVWGGYAEYSKAMGATSQFIGSIGAFGGGATTIGGGIDQFMLKKSLSEMRYYEMLLANMKHQRVDLMEKLDWGLDRLERLFSDLARALEFEEELFLADQMIYR